MLWDLILTSYTINSLPVCYSTNKLLETWLGKAKYFCICCNSKTKQKPATKIQGRFFLLHWGPHAGIRALLRKIFFSPKSSLSMVLHSPLQLIQVNKYGHFLRLKACRDYQNKNSKIYHYFRILQFISFTMIYSYHGFLLSSTQRKHFLEGTPEGLQ